MGLDHGSIVYDRNGWISFVVGLPAPPGYIIAIPKYRPCDDGPWHRASGRYCRVLREYGPRGISEVMAYARLVYDPVYNTLMPYMRYNEAVVTGSPWESLYNAVNAGSWPPLLSILDRLVEAGFSVSDFGVTGSTAAGIQVPGLSDVDLVYRGAPSRLYDAWSEIVDNVYDYTVRDLSGITVEPGVFLGWRRGFLGGVHVSWVGAARACRHVSDYWSIDTPGHRFRGVIRVEPGQDTALAYPPCVETVDGLVLVSYEYNLGDILYKGGKLSVEGVMGEYTVYLGLREEPGRLSVL